MSMGPPLDCPKCVDYREENERLRAQIKGRTLMPELLEQDREIARLKAEVERLQAEGEFHGKRAVEFATRIEEALSLLESSDPPVYGLVVKALKGGE